MIRVGQASLFYAARTGAVSTRRARGRRCADRDRPNPAGSWRATRGPGPSQPGGLGKAATGPPSAFGRGGRPAAAFSVCVGVAQLHLDEFEGRAATALIAVPFDRLWRREFGSREHQEFWTGVAECLTLEELAQLRTGARWSMRALRVEIRERLEAAERTVRAAVRMLFGMEELQRFVEEGGARAHAAREELAAAAAARRR